jgi:hypothetical protein
MSGTVEGWFRINMVGGTDQWITLIPASAPMAAASGILSALT